MHPKLSSFLSQHLVDRAGGHRTSVMRAYQRAKQVNSSSPEAVRAHQAGLLAEMLQHARQHVPWFREHVPADISITPGTAFEVLEHVPVMERSDIQANSDRFIAENAVHLIDDATGGSTGTPMMFKVDKNTQIARESSLYWANSLTHWNYGERVAMLWGSDRDTESAHAGLRTALRWRIDNIRWFNAFNMGEAEMASFHNALSSFRPHLIVAYAGSLHVYAQFLAARGFKPTYPLRALVSSAEVLTPVVREQVECAFGCPVFDRYGNRECGAIAAECSAHDGLHVNATDLIVEIESEDPCKEPGRILITYLRNRGMPLIRYDTGDLGLWHAEPFCSCGCTTRRLAAVQGRSSDTIRTSSGKLIHGEFITHVLYGTQGVRNFQFIQEEINRYRLLVVAKESRSGSDESKWRSVLLDALGDNASLEIEYVDFIEASPSGKRRFVLSMLPVHGPP